MHLTAASSHERACHDRLRCQLRQAQSVLPRTVESRCGCGVGDRESYRGNHLDVESPFATRPPRAASRLLRVIVEPTGIYHKLLLRIAAPSAFRRIGRRQSREEDAFGPLRRRRKTDQRDPVAIEAVAAQGRLIEDRRHAEVYSVAATVGEAPSRCRGGDDRCEVTRSSRAHAAVPRLRLHDRLSLRPVRARPSSVASAWIRMPSRRRARRECMSAFANIRGSSARPSCACLRRRARRSRQCPGAE